MNYESLLIDPRPDLASDSRLWVQLFRLIPTTLENREAARVLSPRMHDLRRAGTLIRRTHSKTEFVPVIGEGNWPSEAFFNEMKRKYLRPYASEIKFLLQKLD